jgi:outer membrane protein assembly factor BamB
MYNSPEIVKAVVPTVAVPLATIMFLLNAIVSWVASLFGLKLDWQGPRDLLRVLLRPRVIVAAVVLNLVTVGLVYAWRQSRTMPSPLVEVEWMNDALEHRWSTVGVGRAYTDSTGRVTEVAPPDRSIVQAVAFRQLWRTKAGRGILGAATVAGDSVFAGSVDGYVYEFNQSDGKLLRRFYVGAEISPDPVVWKNRLFVGEGTHETRRARLYAFDLTSSRFLGAVQTAGHTEGTPTVVHDDRSGRDQLLFVAGSDGIYSVNPLTLELQWHFVGGHTDADPRVLDGRVYFSTGVEKGVPGTNNHFAYALDLQTGARIWRAETPASGWMPGVFVGHEICFGVGEIYTKSSFGQLSCYDTGSGRAGTVASADAPVLSVPLRVGNHVIVADRDGEVCGLEVPHGRRVWCHATHGEENASLTYLAPGVVIYPSATQGLLAFDPENGRTLAAWKPEPADGVWEASNGRATVARSGSAVYLTDTSGNLRKLEVRVHQLD